MPNSVSPAEDVRDCLIKGNRVSDPARGVMLTEQEDDEGF